MARKGMGYGTGKGYKNIAGSDPKIHSQSSKGIKQPQQIPTLNHSKFKQITCSGCGFTYESHPNIFDEKKLNGLCIKCFHEQELKQEDPLKFQDTNQEKLIHENYDWNEQEHRQAFRKILEDSGDVFRELTKGKYSHYSYANEKLTRIENQIKDEESFHSQYEWDYYDYAKEKNPDRFEKLINLWKKQPTNSDIQKVAINLNLALLNKNFSQAKKDIKTIRQYFKDKKD